ncbi:MAG: hypothetical protein J6A79_01740 [Clostridia bacterium]|nr:hypothetical protein [Clostridia bacterium]
MDINILVTKDNLSDFFWQDGPSFFCIASCFFRQSPQCRWRTSSWPVSGTTASQTCYINEQSRQITASVQIQHDLALAGVHALTVEYEGRPHGIRNQQLFDGPFICIACCMDE